MLSSEILSKTIISVPQGCYAEANLKDSKIDGFFTAGMGPCCHIFIYNKVSGYAVACHADAIMNLEDLEHGIPAWISKACPKEDYGNLVINIGETSTNPRPGTDGTKLYYKQTISALKNILKMQDIYDQNVLKSKFTEIGISFQEQFGDKNEDNGVYGISLLKSGNDFKIESIDSNFLNAKEDFKDGGYNILESDISNHIGTSRRTLENSGNKMRPPPVTIFDISEDKLFNKTDIEKIFPQLNFNVTPENSQNNSAKYNSPFSSQLNNSSEYYSDDFELDEPLHHKYNIGDRNATTQDLENVISSLTKHDSTQHEANTMIDKIHLSLIKKSSMASNADATEDSYVKTLKKLRMKPSSNSFEK